MVGNVYAKYYDEEHADAALKDCAAALYVVDDLVDAHLCRANALRALGRHAEARRGAEAWS